MSPEYLVVGAGLTGSVIARTLSDAGRRVMVVERRDHIGGNVYEYRHLSGIPVHAYGPHYFRTNSDRIWRFVNRFAHFRRYEAVVKSLVDGRYENWPVARSCIRRMVGDGWSPAFSGTPANFEEASLALMPCTVYEKFVRGYTEKQWGVPARQLAAGLAARFDVREDDEPRLVRHRYQGLPEGGYAQFMRALLRDIPVRLNCDYLAHKAEIGRTGTLVFTGPIDAYFGYDLGRLRYRGQRRTHEFLPDVDWAQPAVQVNNPDPANGPYIRTLEWKYLMPTDVAARVRGTLLTREVPFTPEDPEGYEYPFPDDANAKLYREYAARANQNPRLLICGRLGEYRYYDMDQAIARAQVLAARLLKGGE